jgi:hypothetical protein
MIRSVVVIWVRGWRGSGWRRFVEEAKAHQGCTADDKTAYQHNSQADKTGQLMQRNCDEIITVHIPVIQIHSIKYSVLLKIKQWYTLF